jgi:hypothetical protein
MKYKVTVREPYRPAYRSAFYASAEQTKTLAAKTTAKGTFACTGISNYKNPGSSVTQPCTWSGGTAVGSAVSVMIDYAFIGA